MHTEAPPSNSIAGLLTSLRDDTTRLLRQEVALAKAELTERATRLASQTAKIAIGAFVAYAGAILLVFAIGDLVAHLLVRTGMSDEAAVWIGRGLVGLILIGVGTILALNAKKAIARTDMTPDQTLQSLQDNKQWAQSKLESSHGTRR